MIGDILRFSARETGNLSNSVYVDFSEEVTPSYTESF